MEMELIRVALLVKGVFPVVPKPEGMFWSWIGTGVESGAELDGSKVSGEEIGILVAD